VKPVCFFARWPGAGPCDGELIRAHLISRRQIRKAVRARVMREALATMTRKAARALADREVARACEDPRSWVACCGGPMGNAGHHGMLDVARTLRIPRDRLPAGVEEFAAELGLDCWLDREYGERPITGVTET
jgi:hypothetical protein